MAEAALNSVGHQKLTVSSTAVGLTKPTGTRPRRAIITVETDAVRWRADGTDPDSSTGIPQAASSRIDWTDPMADYSALIDKVKFIRVTNDATLNIQYFA